MKPDRKEQRAILEEIKRGERVTGDRANWAVNHGLARQGEDGDIDLTPEGAAWLEELES